jgi:hypothetical protein
VVDDHRHFCLSPRRLRVPERDCCREPFTPREGDAQDVRVWPVRVDRVGFRID